MTDMQQPKYMQLVEWVKSQVKNQELRPGEKIYSENELSSRFKISRQTVRHAISELEKEGIVERRQGSGTYISNVFHEVKRADNTMNIAVITTYVDDYIFPGIIKGMERVISEAGYTLQIAFTHNSVEKENSVIKNILERNMADGIIVEPTKSAIPNPNVELYEEIINRKIPAIFFNSYYPQIDLPHVVLDDKKTGYKACEYLINAGCKKIGGIFKSDDRQGHLRYSGYVEALSKNDMRLLDENVLWIDTEDLRSLSMESQRILRRIKGCDGCVCYNDEVAQALVKICLRHGIEIPNDLSIISIDDSDIAVNCEVPLSSIVHPMDKLGEKTAENLINMIKDNKFNATYEFEPVIKERKSVRNINII